MDFFNKLNVKQAQMLKIAGVGILAIVVPLFLVRLLGASFSAFFPVSQRAMVGSAGVGSYAYNAYGGNGAGKAEDLALPELSVRNIAPQPATPPGTVGADAEAFEATQYFGTIETRHVKDTCGKVMALKGKDYVVFEQANESDHRCEYSFKVEHAHADEVLAQIKALQPKDLTESIQTMKRQVDDFTSEKEILEKKRVSIEKTLGDAIQSYEAIAVIATRSQDASSLAKIVENKLQTIERLTQERLAINEQLDRLERAKAEQLDRVAYVSYSLTIVENTFVDVRALKDSWRMAVKAFVLDINRLLQDVTIRLVGLLFFAAQYILYFFLVLLIVKYVWRMAVALWKK